MRKKLVFNEDEWKHYSKFNNWPVNWIPDVFPCLVLWSKEAKEFGRHGFWMIIYPDDLKFDTTCDDGQNESGN